MSPVRGLGQRLSSDGHMAKHLSSSLPGVCFDRCGNNIFKSSCVPNLKAIASTVWAVCRSANVASYGKFTRMSSPQSFGSTKMPNRMFENGRFVSLHGFLIITKSHSMAQIIC
jgi:hypothetical protein